MTNRTKLKTIQAICWAGVAADALWAVALVIPELYGFLIGRPHLQVDLIARLTMGVGASLMMGWTLLLVWASRSPVERRGVLLLTACPVLAGLMVVAIIGRIHGSANDTWILAKCVLLTAAMLYGYHAASSIAKEAVDANQH